MVISFCDNLCGSCDRKNFPLRTISSRFLTRNAASPRAFMSTSTAEALQASASSKAYGSDQIQVILVEALCTCVTVIEIVVLNVLLLYLKLII